MMYFKRSPLSRPHFDFDLDAKTLIHLPNVIDMYIITRYLYNIQGMNAFSINPARQI